MRFADYAKIYVTAGQGGDGMAHFRREKYVPKGGPDGGDGGKGGDIVLVGNIQLNTLLDLRYRKYIKAKKGEHGGTSRKTGRDGESEFLEVPLGTVVYDADTKEKLGEVTEDGEELVAARGGRGGLGNWHFKSAVNQTPQHAQEGRPGEERTIELELKLIADVGLVGFPNAGKSTLLSVISEARPKIADYPFTTLKPNLGVVTYSDYRSFVMADIPGIIEDAHEGKGLGLQFLRHIERNNILLFIVAADSDIKGEYKALLQELGKYNPELLNKPRIVAISKMDLKPDYRLENAASIDDGSEIVEISSATGYNIESLKEKIWEKLEQVGKENPS